MNISDFLSRLKNVSKCSGGWKACCPAHDDRTLSLSIMEGSDGRILIKCHAGCAAEQVVAAMNLTMSDLFPESTDTFNFPAIAGKSAMAAQYRSKKPMHETSFHPYNKDGQPHAGVFRFDPADGSHGKQHLSSLLATLNILAFLFHSFLTFCDDAYTLIRATLPTRQTFFDHIRCLTCYHCFSSWEAMMDFMMRGLEIGPYAEQNA